jgi:DNA-binding transcriptional LysR family regulator
VLSYSTVFIKAFLQAEDAATVLPRATITTELESGRLRRIGGQGRGWYRPVVMCTRRSALPPPALALTMEAIRRSAKRILTQR